MPTNDHSPAPQQAPFPLPIPPADDAAQVSPDLLRAQSVAELEAAQRAYEADQRKQEFARRRWQIQQERDNQTFRAQVSKSLWAAVAGSGVGLVLGLVLRAWSRK